MAYRTVGRLVHSKILIGVCRLPGRRGTFSRCPLSLGSLKESGDHSLFKVSKMLNAGSGETMTVRNADEYLRASRLSR